MQYKDLFLTQQHYDNYLLKLNKQLKEFSHSYMNNSKWKMVFIKIFQNTALIKQCEVVNLFEATINQLKLDVVNFENNIYQEFISDTLSTGEYAIHYKGIIYIEFLKQYQTIINHQTIIVEQNIDDIKNYFNSFGVFEFEQNENYLRVLGYR